MGRKLYVFLGGYCDICPPGVIVFPHTIYSRLCFLSSLLSPFLSVLLSSSLMLRSPRVHGQNFMSNESNPKVHVPSHGRFVTLFHFEVVIVL